MIIRKIEPQDNPKIEQIIKAAFHEFGLPLTGTAYEDNETPNMYESYQADREIYYVIEIDGEVLGGGGIKKLKDNNDNVCELQKMYFNPKARGNGYGKLMFDTCLKPLKILDIQHAI